MTFQFEAVYEGGVLKPVEPLPFAEGQRVMVKVHVAPTRTSQSYGLMGWQGDARALRAIAEDPEFGVMEAQ